MRPTSTNPKWEEFCASRNITNCKQGEVCWEGVKYIFAYRSSLHYVICDNSHTPVELLEALSLRVVSSATMISSVYNFAVMCRVVYLVPSANMIGSAYDFAAMCPDNTAFRDFKEALARLATKKHFIETMELTEEEQSEIVI
jgi:hypothetical protein